MQLAATWLPAVAAVVVLAVVARAAKAVSTSGALAGLVVGAGVAAGFGAAGLVVLGAFFLGGTLATRIAWEKKSARGTAERGGGARGARRVLGKGGVAAALGVLAAVGTRNPIAFAGALAAALGDTLGTEIGSASNGAARALPSFRVVPHGTPGAVSVAGLLATAGGGLVVAAAALAADATGWETAIVSGPTSVRSAAAIVVAAAGGSALESVAAGVAPAIARIPGWIRNLFTTAAGAVLAHFVSGVSAP